MPNKNSHRGRRFDRERKNAAAVKREGQRTTATDLAALTAELHAYQSARARFMDDWHAGNVTDATHPDADRWAEQAEAAEAAAVADLAPYLTPLYV